MAAPRIDMHRLQELVRLHRLGVGPREVARLLRMSPKTELRYRTVLDAHDLLAGAVEKLPELEELRTAVLDGVGDGPVRCYVSSVDPWRKVIKKKAWVALYSGRGPPKLRLWRCTQPRAAKATAGVVVVGEMASISRAAAVV